MKVFHTIRFLVLGLCVIIGFVFQVFSCDAASLPLPQKIMGPQLQRDDCVTNESNFDAPFTAYIQEFIFTDTRAGISLYSCINWRDGFLKSEGIGKKGSRRAAELVARNNALKTLLVVTLDSRFTLQDYFNRQSQVRIKIQNVLIKNAKIEDLATNPEKPDDVSVMLTIPFYGISGLSSFLLNDRELYLEPPTSPTDTQPKPGEYTGIIVDVRGIADIQPAILPKIISEDGEIVYEASQVGKDVLQTQGMVEYVRETQENTAWRSGDRPFVVKPILLAATTEIAGVFLNSGNLKHSLHSQFFAQAQTRKRRRKGNNLIVEATNSTGDIPVNVVVSVEDAKKIKQLNETNQFDKQGNYTILIGGEIGGVKGQYPDIIFAMQ